MSVHGPYTTPEDHSKPGKIKRALVVYWSRRRAWHGEKVKLSVRTENVPDGATVKIEITSDGGIEVAVVEGLKVKASKVDPDHEYTIEWKDNPKQPQLLAARARKFVAKAMLVDEENVTSTTAEPLWVDLQPPLFSV